MKTYVIAEAGSCHDGDRQKAEDLVKMAADVGASACKFQFWSNPDKLADRRRVPQFYRDFYHRYALPVSWLEPLWMSATSYGLGFLCSTFLPEDVAVVAPYVTHFKVASFEATSADLISAHVPFLEADRQAERDRWLIISRGMGAAHPPIKSFPDDDFFDFSVLKYLLCTSAYPAPAAELNLSRLGGREGDECLVGFSDHSDPTLTWTGALAVAAGATIVEAHLRHWLTDHQNPDYKHAMNVPQFRDYIKHIRFAESCLGDGLPRAQPSEAPMMAYRSQERP